MTNLCGIQITDKIKSTLFTINEELNILVPMNAECFVKSNEERDLFSFINSKCRTTIDGQIPIWLYKRKYPNDKIEKLSGSDLIYDYCSWAEKNKYKVYFLGGKKISNVNAILKIRAHYKDLQIDGLSPKFEPYPFTIENNELIKNSIKSFKPDILFVGFGFGKQEFWCKDNMEFLQESEIKWIICCGGTFEFISGDIKRAPKFIQKIGFEGVWRLIMEPKLFRLKRLFTSLKIFKYAYTK